MGAMYSDNAEISSDDDNSIDANRSNSNQINHFGVDIRPFDFLSSRSLSSVSGLTINS